MNAPDWMEVLRTRCAQTSQARVAAEIGMSATTVSQVLAGKYGADLNRVRERVEGALMRRTVECPVLGELPRNQCLDHQGRPFAATNPQRVMLWRACRGCPHREQREEKAS